MKHTIVYPVKEKSDILKIKTNKPFPQMVRKILLFCGFLSSLYYVAINIYVPTQFPGYSVVTQTISELSAIGAPTRSLWVFLCIFYSLLVIAFGFGVWQSAGGNRQLRVIGSLMIIYGISGFFWPPMHQREVLAAGGGTATDTMHLVFSFVTVGMMLTVIGFGAASFGKRFRSYSIATIVGLLLFGFLTGSDAERIAKNLPTPLTGIWERINIGVFMLWVMIVAMILLKKKKKEGILNSTKIDQMASKLKTRSVQNQNR